MFQYLAQAYHGGQFSALYAYASSGTVTIGLAREVESALRIAENGEYWDDIETLEEFQQWATI